MAKTLLNGFKLAGDVIDRVASEPVAAVLVPQNSGEASPESPPVGAVEQEAAPAAGAEPELRQDGLFQVFRLGEIQYRVGGVKALFVTALRVNIRASEAGGSYYDSLDLYSARARSGFGLALQKAWGADAARVERDLVRILEALEGERDRQLASGSQKPRIEVSAEDRVLGLDLLRDPGLFQRIEADLEVLGYVGERLNKRLLYLCASSRKLEDPISVMILSQSASGKSYLVDCVKKLMPPEDVVAVTSLSDQALNYIEDLQHKFLVLGEAVHGEVVEHQIREMLSGKELSRLVTVKDPETGKMVSQVMRTPVVVASVMSGTNHGINPENASRVFVVNTDESVQQTAKIHESQRRRYSLESLKTRKSQVEAVVRRHQAAQRLLRPVLVVNELAPYLDFPTTLMRLRRDHERFLSLIGCVAYLRQYQKRVQSWEGQAFVTCDLADYEVAYEIMVEGVLASTVREIPKGALVLWEQIREWACVQAMKEGVGWEEVGFTQRQVREATGLGHTWIKQNLRVLVEYEYVSLSAGGTARSRGYYRLRPAPGAGGLLERIPRPEDLAARLGVRS